MNTRYWKVKPDIQKETHQRHALIELASDINTPKDILDSDFGEPQLKFRQTVAMDAHVELLDLHTGFSGGIKWSGIPIPLRIFQFAVIHTVKGFGTVCEAEVDFFFFWNSVAFSMIHQMLAI